MKMYFCENLFKNISLIIVFISSIIIQDDFLQAENLSEDLQIDSSTKTDNESSGLPTNPFEIVEMIRRYNSLNDATNPSDAIDDALKSFNDLEDKQ